MKSDEKSERLLKIPIDELLQLKLNTYDLAVYLAIHATAFGGICVHSQKQLAEIANVSHTRTKASLKRLCWIHPYYGRPLIRIESRQLDDGSSNTNAI